MVTCSKFITETEIEIRDDGCGIILSDETGVILTKAHGIRRKSVYMLL